MDDFLYNLRTGNHKRSDGNRKQYDGRNVRNFDRQKTRDRRNGFHQQKGTQDLFSTIKPLLEGIGESHKRIAGASERKANAEERKADALISIAACLKILVGLETTPAKTNIIDSPSAPEAEDDPKDKNPAINTAEVDREEILGIIRKMREDKISFEKIAQHLTSKGIRNFSGKNKWSSSTISRLFRQ